jgi:hypothetical protein
MDFGPSMDDLDLLAAKENGHASQQALLSILSTRRNKQNGYTLINFLPTNSFTPSILQ